MAIVDRGYENLDYFDNFFTTEIDLSEYLKKFSTDDYTLKFQNLQPITVTIKNLFEQSKVVADFKTRTTRFSKYRIQTGERLENISFNLYKTIDFWWIVALFNNIKNPFFDLPLSEEQAVTLSKIMKERENKYPEKIYYDLISEANEKKREIVVPKDSDLPEIIWQFRQDHISRLKIKGLK